VLVGRHSGLASLLITTEAGVVLDFVHVWVTAPSRLALHRLAADRADLGRVEAPIELVAGESIYLTPQLYDRDQRLLGQADLRWGASSEAVSIHRDGTRYARRLVARNPGRSTVTVDSAGQRASVDIVVLP
jgi:hypothetical protein